MVDPDTEAYRFHNLYWTFDRFEDYIGGLFILKLVEEESYEAFIKFFLKCTPVSFDFVQKSLITCLNEADTLYFYNGKIPDYILEEENNSLTNLNNSEKDHPKDLDRQKQRDILRKMEDDVSLFFECLPALQDISRNHSIELVIKIATKIGMERVYLVLKSHAEKIRKMLNYHLKSCTLCFKDVISGNNWQIMQEAVNKLLNS